MFEDPEGYMRDFQTRMASMVERASSLGDAMAGASATAASPDGEVEVTVGVGGALQELRLGPGIRQMSAVSLAEMIKAVYRQAADSAGRNATGALAEVFGEDNELVRQARARSEGQE
ncbi:YbaB/EbfC family nucleoid-associated protein [Glycomyces terrestris]|uniref:YbaB/EbfC family nucleoid-associated protein n=1 Tax=Glycomyces terrestris TaxID=2493553 RepID=UPI0013152FB7|nr:YbaB/EbfC family nucleoid-associated protein [Glycomyces terrestris]